MGSDEVQSVFEGERMGGAWCDVPRRNYFSPAECVR